MEQQNNYADDIINRYVYQVTKHLPYNTRNDIEKELRSLISDMLDERTHASIPNKEDIDSVLIELGNPYELADKYRDKSRYLIGPAIYPTWMMILKIVFGAVLLGITISSALELLTSHRIVWYEYIGSCFVNLIGGLFMAFAWVTLIFAFVEWRGVNIKDLKPDWNISSLPPVTVHEVSIPIWGPVAEVLFTIIIMLIFILTPQLIGVYINSDVINTIPLFNLSVLKVVLPLFLICMGLGILKCIWKLIDRKYSIKYSVFTLIINILEIILTLIIFKGFAIWNPDFINEVNNYFHFVTDNSVYTIWNNITNNFIIFLILVYILDSATTLYKSFKSEGRNFFNF